MVDLLVEQIFSDRCLPLSVFVVLRLVGDVGDRWTVGLGDPRGLKNSMTALGGAPFPSCPACEL